MGAWHILLDVVVLLSVAMGMGILFERLGQSAIVAYLLTGLLVGPGVLGLVRNESSVHFLAELGVALLLFTVGLEISWHRLKEFGTAALAGGAMQMVLTGALITIGAMIAGVSTAHSVVLGAIAAPSSTACVIRVLGQRAELDSIHGRTSLGILLFQDAAVIPLILLVTSLGQGAESQGLVEFLQNGLWAGLTAIGFFLLVNYVVPHLLDAAVVTRNRELPILFATASCLAASWAAHSLHFSPVLGAFVAGVLLADSPYATWIRSDVSVLRTLFVTLFFASVGMLDDVEWIKSHWHWLAISVPVVLVVKSGIVLVVGLVLRMPLRYAVASAMCLAQFGEFSFVLAGVARTGSVISSDMFNLVIGTTVLTLIITPYLVAWAPRAASWIGRRSSTYAADIERIGSDHDESKWQGHVVLVGFGPAGRAVLKSLQSAGIAAAIVDLNRRSILSADHPNVLPVVGDATREAVLEHAHVSTARAVVITAPDHGIALQVIALARLMAPAALIFARARYDAWASQLVDAGAFVVNEEHETGSRLGQELVAAIGASPRVLRDD